MSLCQMLAMATLWAFGHEALELKQPQVSLTKDLSTTARVTCQVSSSQTFESKYIHWYQQKPSQPLQHLLSVQSTSIPSQKSLHEIQKKFVAEKNKDKGTSILTISSITREDEATYYCACWDGPAKVFGEGTKLIVTNSVIKKKPPKPIFFLPTLEEVKQKKSGTYICLLEDFFPNVVKTYWKENENSSPLNAQLGPITRTNGSYSQVSWLTVQEDNLPKNFTYFYQHEDVGIEPMAVPLPSVWEVFNRSHPSDSCEKTEVKDKGLQELHFANTSAFYTYTILLTKSAIYFTITLFFLYQKRAAGSQETKYAC